MLWTVRLNTTNEQFRPPNPDDLKVASILTIPWWSTKGPDLKNLEAASFAPGLTSQYHIKTGQRCSESANTHARTHARICTHTHTHTHTELCFTAANLTLQYHIQFGHPCSESEHTHTHTHTCTCTHTQSACTPTHSLKHVHTHTYFLSHTHAHSHAHPHPHMHAHTYTHTTLNRRPQSVPVASTQHTNHEVLNLHLHH